MPVSVRKVNGYRVTHGGKVSAKSTSARNAMAQKRLLLAVRHGWKPSGQKASPRSEKAIRTMVMKHRATKKKT